MLIHELLRYADWSRDVLRSTLEANPDVWDREFETLSGFKSVRALVTHMAGAEERWSAGLLNLPRPDPTFEERAGGSMPEVFAGWDLFRSRTREFVTNAGPEKLSEVLHIAPPRFRFETHKSVEQVLHHLFNHQTYHLGQVSMAMQRFDIDPPFFDVILMPSQPGDKS